MLSWVEHEKKILPRGQANSAAQEIYLLINLKILTKFWFFFMLNSAEHETFHAQRSWAYSAELNMKKVLIAGIFIFMTKWNFMLSWAEHDKSSITSGPSYRPHPNSGAFLLAAPSRFCFKCFNHCASSLLLVSLEGCGSQLWQFPGCAWGGGWVRGWYTVTTVFFIVKVAPNYKYCYLPFLKKNYVSFM